MDGIESITYRGGYKYQLAEDYTIRTWVLPAKPSGCPFLYLSEDGVLTIKAGYAWDGPSGPVIDRPSTMRGALVHDALYQLMRIGCVQRDLYKDAADRLFQSLCVQDGVYEWLAWLYYQGLKKFGRAATLFSNRKELKVAP